MKLWLETDIFLLANTIEPDTVTILREEDAAGDNYVEDDADRSTRC